MRNRVLKKNDFNKLLLWNYCAQAPLSVASAMDLFEVSHPSVHRMVQEINTDLSTKEVGPQLFIKHEHIHLAPQSGYPVRTLLLEMYLEHSQVYRLLRHLYLVGPTSSYELSETLAISYSYVLKSINYINSELSHTAIQVKKEGKRYCLSGEESNLHAAVCLIRSYLQLTPAVTHQLSTSHQGYSYLSALIKTLNIDIPSHSDLTVNASAIVQALSTNKAEATLYHMTLLIILSDHPEAIDQLPLDEILRELTDRQQMSPELRESYEEVVTTFDLSASEAAYIHFKLVLFQAISHILPGQTLYYFSLLTSRITTNQLTLAPPTPAVSQLLKGLKLTESDQPWYQKELTDMLLPYLRPQLKVAILCLSPRQSDRLKTFISQRLAQELLVFVSEEEAQVVISNYPLLVQPHQVHLPLDYHSLEQSATQIVSQLLALSAEKAEKAPS